MQWRTPKRIAVREVDLDTGVGARIVFASDLHARRGWFGPDAVRRVVDAINAVDGADAVLFGGDFVVDDDLETLTWAPAILGEIAAPTIATLGNHDMLAGARPIARALEDAGIRVLVNEHVLLESVPLAVLGVDSRWGGRPDVEAARRGVPDDIERIVLGHEPALALEHRELLHLAGHTHHGQVRPWPFGELAARRAYPRFSQPYPHGLYHVAERQFVYTSAGLGYSTFPLRIACPSEIVVVNL